MAQAIQNNPEIGAVLQAYQQGDYDGLLNSQAALQALADSTGVSVDVIITRITQELRAKGATDGQLVAIDGDISNREDVIKTTAHELDHVRGGSSETLANLAGIAANLNVSASMDANQDEIDKYKTYIDSINSSIKSLQSQVLGLPVLVVATTIDKVSENPLSFFALLAYIVFVSLNLNIQYKNLEHIQILVDKIKTNELPDSIVTGTREEEASLKDQLSLLKRYFFFIIIMLLLVLIYIIINLYRIYY